MGSVCFDVRLAQSDSIGAAKGQPRTLHAVSHVAGNHSDDVPLKLYFRNETLGFSAFLVYARVSFAQTKPIYGRLSD